MVKFCGFCAASDQRPPPRVSNSSAGTGCLGLIAMLCLLWWGSAAQQLRQIGNCPDDPVGAEAELLGRLGGAALDPERDQARRRGAGRVPGVRRSEEHTSEL